MQSIQSYRIADEVISHLLQLVHQKIVVNQVMEKYLVKYCSEEGWKYCREVCEERNRNPSTQQKCCTIESYPSALLCDNFFPTTTTLPHFSNAQHQNKKTAAIGKGKRSRKGLPRASTQVSLKDQFKMLGQDISRKLPNQFHMKTKAKLLQ
jgi:hypothetical protein